MEIFPIRQKIWLFLAASVCLVPAPAWSVNCDATFDVGQSGQPFSTIQSAVNAIPASLTQNVCVVIHDAQTYAEQVTIQNIVPNNFGIAVMADPALNGSKPTVAPPTGSTAAFVIQNDSVTLQSLIITPTDPISYGILSSSSVATLNSLQMSDVLGFSTDTITNAGVSLSSNSVITNSTIHILSPNAITADGPGIAINQTSVTNGTLSLINTQSARVTGNTFSGAPAVFVSGSTDTVLGANTLNTNYTNPSLTFTGGSSGLIVSSSSLSGTVLIDTGTQGYIQLLNNSLTAGFFGGIKVLSPLAGSQVWITSNTIAFASNSNFLAGASDYGIYLEGLTTGATVQNNGIFLRGMTWTMSNGPMFWLLAHGCSGLNIDHNRFSDPDVVAGGAFWGIDLSATTNSWFAYNDVYASYQNPNLDPLNYTNLDQGYLLKLDNGSTGVQVFNNVFVSSITPQSSSATIIVSADSEAGFISDYNAFWSSNAIVSADWGGHTYGLASSWSANTGQDAHSIITLPLWKAYVAFVEDFHPLSERGRYDPNSGTFVLDSKTAATIDAGNPADPFGLEPSPNGGRVNLGSYGDTAQASKSAPPPGSPAVAAVFSTSITFTFSAVNSNGYEADASPVADFSSGVISTTTSNAAAAQIGIQVLTPNTTYFLRVGATYGSNNNFVNAVPASTATLAADPNALTLGAVSSTTINLSWSGNGNPGDTTYEIQESSTASFTPILTSTYSSAVITNLVSSMTYSYRVRAINRSGLFSGFSNSVTTATIAQVPGVPGTPQGQALGVSSINWTWTAASNASSYNVYQATGGAFLAATASTAFTETGLSTNTAHGIYVQAVNSGGSALSASATNYTLAQVPGTPAITVVSSSSVSLSWSANTNPGSTFFDLEDSTGGPFVTISSSTSNSFAAINLISSTTYTFKVRAINGDGLFTAFSSAVSTNTLPLPPGQPGTPVGQALGVSSITWTWTAASSATSYNLYQATSPSTLVGTTAANTFILTGLSTNTAHGILVQAVNVSGNLLSAAATTYTAAAVPSGLAVVSASSSSITVSWSANTNPNGTTYDLEESTAGTFSIVASTSGTSFTTASLVASTTYTFKVRAVNGDGFFSGFSSAVSTTTLSQVPDQPGTPTGLTLGVSSISWTWSAANNATKYLLYSSSSSISSFSSTTELAHIKTGLSPNATDSFGVAASNASGASPISVSTTAIYTFANPPSNSTVTAVYISSAVISWSLNSNPAYTVAELQRSTDNASFAPVFSGTGVTDADTALNECSTYFYRIRNLNGNNLPTAFDSVVTLVTQGSTPLPPSRLAAVSVLGNRVSLAWTPSADVGISSYKLYFDSGTGKINYSSPLAILSSSTVNYTTGVLVSSGAYRFGLRAVNSCGNEETNADVVASAASIAAPSALRVSIQSPGGGLRIAGNRVTVSAGFISGGAAQTRQILFQYRASTATLWTDMSAADAEHLNPSVAAPYSIHWDVTNLTATNYDLRAVATDSQGSVDTSPASVTVTVDPVNFDLNETDLGGGKVQVSQQVNNAVANTIQSTDGGSPQMTTLTIPAGALDISTVTVTVVNNPVSVPVAPKGASSIGSVTQIDLSNGQHLLTGGQTATIRLSYSDTDNNGIVDGTLIRADQLKMYSYDTASGKWVKDFDSTVDTVNHVIVGNTPHFSLFGLFAPLAANLSTLRVYPNPFKPDSGDPNLGAAYSAGNLNSGIIFDNLPQSVTIKVYTLTGQLVADFGSGSSGGRLQWNVKNGDGRDVASGGYVAVITSPGLKPVTKKILVLR